MFPTLETDAVSIEYIDAVRQDFLLHIWECKRSRSTPAIQRVRNLPLALVPKADSHQQGGAFFEEQRAWKTPRDEQPFSVGRHRLARIRRVHVGAGQECFAE